MRMVCRDTVEEKLIRLQASKRRMSQQAMERDGAAGTAAGAGGEGGNKLSLDDLKGLFL
jgi:SNF2 family DNA or RNA helicase